MLIAPAPPSTRRARGSSAAVMQEDRQQKGRDGDHKYPLKQLLICPTHNSNAEERETGAWQAACRSRWHTDSRAPRAPTVGGDGLSAECRACSAMGWSCAEQSLRCPLPPAQREVSPGGSAPWKPAPFPFSLDSNAWIWEGGRSGGNKFHQEISKCFDAAESLNSKTLEGIEM